MKVYKLIARNAMPLLGQDHAPVGVHYADAPIAATLCREWDSGHLPVRSVRSEGADTSMTASSMHVLRDWHFGIGAASILSVNSTFVPTKQGNDQKCSSLLAIPSRTMKSSRTRDRAGRAMGFTLIEVMIVVVIVGILAAIAYPSFLAQIRKGHRAETQSYMMDLAQRQAQYLLDARGYASTEAALGYIATPPDVAAHYTIGIAAPPLVSPPSFTVTATPFGSQVADGALTIDSQGTKTPSDKW